MKIIFLFCYIGFAFPPNTLFGSDLDSTKTGMSFGVTGGVSQHNSLSADVYVISVIQIFSNSIEGNYGYTYFKNKTSYSGVKDLYFNSHGLFIEGNYYLSKSFFIGTRFVVNFNFVDAKSQNNFKKYSNLDSPTYFSGLAGYGQIGYLHQIGEIFCIKLQGQFGLHAYKITEDWLLIDNSSSELRDAQNGIENHSDFLYNISIGLTVQL